MKIRLSILLTGMVLLLSIASSCDSKPDRASVTIYCTSDVHGTYFNYDLKRDKEARSSLSNVSAYMKQARKQDSTGIILLDNGDFLQGQPTNYYYNVIDTTQVNVAAQILNYLKYDAGSVGNHDIETGHSVYDKITREYNFPWLSANTIDETTGKSYFKPYTVLERNGVKIAILGLTTPGIPKWLPKHLWKGLQFEDMIETAKIWVPQIQQEEKPDVLIGLFHSGVDYNYAGENEQTPNNENAGVLVAQQVDGFDVVILGHDHQEYIKEITNNAGHKVLIFNPKSHATYLGKITIDLTRKNNEYEKTFNSELISLADVPQDTAYNDHFAPQLDEVKTFVNTELGEFTATMSGRDGIFGPSAFTDFIHNAQLAVTDADISFSTVLQMDATINKGPVTMRDMFNLYSFENGLYTMTFSGAEIDKYLEYASDLQYNTMTTENDHLLKFKTDSTGSPAVNKKGRYDLANPFFNFSCAAGIKYTVDVTKAPGQRVTILSMSDGTTFDENKTYRVAINSYRGNGGGGHLSQGIGLSKEEVESRIADIKEKDVRFYLIEYIKQKETLTPECRNDWKVIPEKWFQKGKERDYKLIYN